MNSPGRIMDAGGWVDVEVDVVEAFTDVVSLFDVPAAPTGAAVFAFFFGGGLIPFLSRR